MMINVKDESVNIHGLNKGIVKALPHIAIIYMSHGQKLIITSARDGLHSYGSTHYIGDSVDIRTRFFDEQEKKSVYREIKATLGIAYKVIWHDTHIHVEFIL